MKILTICMILLSLLQVFCENSSAGRASNKKVDTPLSTDERRKEMSENNAADALRRICQMTLDLPKLQPYLHPELKERNPLRVLKNAAIKQEVSLMKFDKPVEFVADAEAGKTTPPVFEFTRIDITDKTATVEYRYAVEGIRGKAEFKLTKDWELVSESISES